MHPDPELVRRYPHLTFRKQWQLDADTMYLLGQCKSMVQAICLIPLQPAYREMLLDVSLIKGAQATTAIEGNTLSEAEVEKVSEGQALPPSKEYQAVEVKNILDAMNDILTTVAHDGKAELISTILIKQFHYHVGRDLGEHFDAIPGQFRTDDRVVGPYRCPRPQDVEELIEALCAWLKRDFGFAQGNQKFTDAVVQAIVTHVYIEWIHPFGDGNGRTGRLLEFYILLRAGNPDIASHILSNFYNETRTEYYRQLDVAGKTGDLSAFIRYAVQGYCDGLNAIMEAIIKSNVQTAWRHLVYSRFADRPHRKVSVFKRRRRLALAMPTDRAMALSDLMMLTPELAREYAQLTERTLIRDLEELMAMDIVVEKAGLYRSNFGLLTSHMAQRRRDVATTVEKST